ncbi:MAG TPA: nuclear transport factor 2 family protein [Pyrinomonadaceae bacterium]|jgi:ketosteroid isomerase-like protein
MSEQENVSLVQQIYSDFKTGNIEALLAKIDPNIIWELPEIQNVPFAGKRNGREAVADFFKVVNVSQEALRFDAMGYVAQGDRVVSLGTYEWRVFDTGRTFTANFAHVFTIQNGAVTEFTEYTDTALAEHAYQKAMSA